MKVTSFFQIKGMDDFKNPVASILAGASTGLATRGGRGLWSRSALPS